MKYQSYDIVHYRQRNDGRIEPAGRERLVLSREEALDLSYTALVIAREGFGGSQVVLHEGKHAQYDPHLGWVS